MEEKDIANMNPDHPQEMEKSDQGVQGTKL